MSGNWADNSVGWGMIIVGNGGGREKKKNKLVDDGRNSCIIKAYLIATLNKRMWNAEGIIHKGGDDSTVNAVLKDDLL